MANENAEAKGSYVLNKLKFAFDDAMSVIQKSVKDRKGLDPLKDLVDAEEDTPEGKKELDAVRIEWETATPHELGKYQLSKGLESPELEADKTYLLVGSVDRTSFDKKAKREEVIMYKDAAGHDVNWYEDTRRTAEMFLKFKDHVDFSSFKKWTSDAKKERLLSIMEAISWIPDTDLNDASWQKALKDKKFTDEEIYGEEGAYNMLLAFNRASVATDSGFTLDDFKTGDSLAPKIFKIRLELAGKAGGKDDVARYSRLISTKVIEENVKIGEEDGGTPATDASAPDAGATAPDAGATAPDAGATAPDAGATAPDAEATAPDAGASAPDAGAGPETPAAGPDAH